MNSPNVGIPVREPSQTGLDDTILPFEVSALDLRGRIVRLGPAVDVILSSHDYPLPVAKLLGEAIDVLANELAESGEAPDLAAMLRRSIHLLGRTR